MLSPTGSFSVDLPAYDAGPSIYAAIASILCQTLPDLALMVIDDGSTNDTLGPGYDICSA